MKFLFAPSLGIVLVICVGISGQSVPPGAPTPHSTDVPVVLAPEVIHSSTTFRPHVDPLELRRKAKQILDLSESLQPDFEAVTRGELPKDTIEKLRRIEKLSKNLRNQIEK